MVEQFGGLSPIATLYERIFASGLLDNNPYDVVIIGSSVGAEAARYLHTQGPDDRRIAILDSGALDVMAHVAGTPTVSRQAVLLDGHAHFGGKSTLWGVSSPRPPWDLLTKWPYPMAVLQERFEAYERRLGVRDVTPKSDRALSARVRDRLTAAFPQAEICNAPLAIDRDGVRWTSLAAIPALLAETGVSIHPRVSCTRLIRENNRIVAVEGIRDGKERFKIKPAIVVLATGAEASIPLVRQVADRPLVLEAADHIRIDLHDRLPPDHFGALDIEEAGVAVLFMEYTSRTGVPAHFEIKIAPRDLWRRNYMQSADNLRGEDDDEALYVQIQLVSAMTHRLPSRDLLNVNQPLSPVMHADDVTLHAELAAQILSIARALGLVDPKICFRPLLTNHHVFGAFRVGNAVTREFRFHELENLYILPPAAYVDEDDDANPMLKSLVLASFAMDAVARDLRERS